MPPIVNGRIINGIETIRYTFPNGLRKVITNDNALGKITVETFKSAADEAAGNAYKVKTLNFNPAMESWMGTTRYTQPAQYVCYDIKDGVVKGAHLDTAREDISRTLTFNEQAPVSNVRDVLNYLLVKGDVKGKIRQILKSLKTDKIVPKNEPNEPNIFKTPQKLLDAILADKSINVMVKEAKTDALSRHHELDEAIIRKGSLGIRIPFGE